jgi:hypothetical protein
MRNCIMYLYNTWGKNRLNSEEKTHFTLPTSIIHNCTVNISLHGNMIIFLLYIWIWLKIPGVYEDVFGMVLMVQF